MKHPLSAAAAGLLALGLAPAHAQGGAPASGVTIYGVADAGIEWSNNGAGWCRAARWAAGSASAASRTSAAARPQSFAWSKASIWTMAPWAKAAARSAGRPPSAWQAPPGAP